MRRWMSAAVVGVASVALSGAPPFGPVPARAATDTSTGTYGVPFREDHAQYVGATTADGSVTGGQFEGGQYNGQPTDANGCVATSDAERPYSCLPAGATIVQLADGRLLYWNALEGSENITGTNAVVPDGGRLTVNDQSRVLTLKGDTPAWAIPTPKDGGAHNTSTGEDLPLPAPLAASHYPYNDGSLFCSDQVILSDGSVFTAGGTDYYSEPTVPGTDKGVIELEGIRNTRIFIPSSNRWVQSASMNHGRWYPSLVTLGNGQVFVASGVTKLIKPVYPSHALDSGTNVRQTETYDPTSNTWTPNGTSADPSSGDRSLPLFPRLHLLPNGHVYYDAAGQDYNPQGQSYDEVTWNMAATYDPATKSWHDLTIPGLGSPFAGFRGSTFSAALALRPTAAGYTKASYLTAGGVIGTSPGSYVPVNDSRITTVDVSGGQESLSTVPTGQMSQARWYSTAVPLPDGTVYAVNGADVDEVVSPGYESPITTAELFTPEVGSDGQYTGGTWRSAGTVARKRTYHNNAVLLPDGRVLIGGHAPIPSGYAQTRDGTDLPGRPGTNNHHDPSFQIYEPPYFHKVRPTVGDVEQEGRTLVVETPDASTIASVVLMRNTAQTHLVDADARTVQLPIVSRGRHEVVVALPASTNVLPNGPYLLFTNANRANPSDSAPGHVIPSVGRQVFVTGTSTPSILAGRQSHTGSAVMAGAASTGTATPSSAARGPIQAVATSPASASNATALASDTTSTRLASSRRRPIGYEVPAALALLIATGALLTRGRRRRSFW